MNYVIPKLLWIAMT